ncbi:mechanosensitive ion channel family protein [Conexibacter sp. SYSU D00693]|uniref:mechanosensitive ion channel family protein n=1 Tax=Conexibacter sp. SYSU D00693 TaxID=2812560 RepID=UPI00196B27A9|nr:mechanosensitive ion channel family protein [Conexibacter sp. SYSU D00693]
MDAGLVIAAVSDARARSVCGEDPGWFCRQVLDWTGDRTWAEAADFLIGKPLSILLVLVIAVVVNRLARRGVKRALRTLQSGTVQERLGAVRRATPDALLETTEHSLRAEQRIEALASVLRSLITFVIFAVAAFMALGEIGIELGPLIAGAGILGVALGFGSQSLVKDFLSGIFILIEDQFGVGDIVDLDGETSGTVEAVSLRTTRLRSVDGTVWHVPNGEIRRVGNKSQHWSRALLDVEVAYGTDLAEAQRVLKDVAHAVAAEDHAVLEEPEVWGVERFSPSGVVLRMVVKTTPSEQYRISRILREQVKLAFDGAGIEIPHAVTVTAAAAPSGAPAPTGGPPSS